MPSRERCFYFLSCLLTAGILTPDHFLPWPAFRNDVVIGVAFFPFICQVIRREARIPKEGLLLLIFSLIPLLQMQSGKIVFRGDGWISWLYLSSAALTLTASFNFFRSSISKDPLQDLLPMVWASLSAAVVSIGILLSQWLSLELLPGFFLSVQAGARPGANLAQPNQLATVLLIGLASVSFLFEAKKLKSAVAIILSVFLLFGLAVTQSRTAFLSLVFACLLYFGLHRSANLTIKKNAVLALTAFFILATLLLPCLNEVLLLKQPQSMFGRTSKDVRVDLWISMIDAMARAPWTGYGWGQISVAQQAVALDHPATYAFFDSAHNIFLDVALWAGIPVGLSFAAFLFFWFKRQIVICRDPLSWSVLFAIGVVFCHSMVEYPLSYAYILLPTCLFMGALSGKSAGDLKVRAKNTFIKPILLIVGGATLVGFFAISIEYIRFENEWRAVRFAAAGIEKKDKNSPRFKPIFLTQLGEFSEFSEIEPARGMSDAQLTRMGQVAARFGQSSVLMRYAIAAALNGGADVSTRSLAILCKTQSPLICERSIERWKKISLDPAYPEFKKVVLPELPKKDNPLK